MKNLFFLIFLSTLVLAGCGEKETPPPEAPPEEPPGVAVTMNDSQLKTEYPEYVREHISWAQKAEELRLKGVHDKALFCLHRAQETFPKERPADWKGPSEPLSVYLRKADTYTFMGELDFAEYYLSKVEKAEDKSIKMERFQKRSRAQLEYAKGNFQAALDTKAPQDNPYNQTIAAAAKVRLGDESARKDMKEAWVKLKAKKDGLYHCVPPDIRDLANEKP